MKTIYKIETIKVALSIAAPGHSKTSSSAAVVAILRGIYEELDADQEHFCLLALDYKNKIRSYKVLFTGGNNNSIIDPKVVFRTALLLGASRLILAHNHPSGEPEPSAQDIELTHRLTDLGRSLEVEVLDHIIVCHGSFFSFSDRGMMHSSALSVPAPKKTRKEPVSKPARNRDLDHKSDWTAMRRKFEQADRSQKSEILAK